MKQSVTVGAQLLWSGRYGCNNGRYGCTIVMSHIEINKAVSQWLLTFNLCVSVTWPLTCAFHIPCTHTPEIIDMHRGMCDNSWVNWGPGTYLLAIVSWWWSRYNLIVSWFSAMVAIKWQTGHAPENPISIRYGTRILSVVYSVSMCRDKSKPGLGRNMMPLLL